MKDQSLGMSLFILSFYHHSFEVFDKVGLHYHSIKYALEAVTRKEDLSLIVCFSRRHELD